MFLTETNRQMFVIEANEQALYQFGLNANNADKPLSEV